MVNSLPHDLENGVREEVSEMVGCGVVALNCSSASRAEKRWGCSIECFTLF